MTDPIRCIDGCGQQVATVQEAEAKAWQRLEITGRYRCPACRKQLEDINQARKEAS